MPGERRYSYLSRVTINYFGRATYATGLPGQYDYYGEVHINTTFASTVGKPRLGQVTFHGPVHYGIIDNRPSLPVAALQARLLSWPLASAPFIGPRLPDGLPSMESLRAMAEGDPAAETAEAQLGNLFHGHQQAADPELEGGPTALEIMQQALDATLRARTTGSQASRPTDGDDQQVKTKIKPELEDEEHEWDV